MPVEFVGKEIKVELSDDAVRLPQRFVLAGRDYQVAEVLASWQDHGYSGLPAPRRGWQGGSQRQFYRLRTADGETFEIYVETPAGRRARAQKARWYASRRLLGAAAPNTAPAPAEEPVEAPPTQPAKPSPRAAPARRRRGG